MFRNFSPSGDLTNSQKSRTSFLDSILKSMISKIGGLWCIPYHTPMRTSSTCPFINLKSSLWAENNLSLIYKRISSAPFVELRQWRFLTIIWQKKPLMNSSSDLQNKKSTNRTTILNLLDGWIMFGSIPFPP